MTITDKQLNDMLHALGAKHEIPNRSRLGWRNYYYASADDAASWDYLVSIGLAELIEPKKGCGYAQYKVSDYGMKLLGVTEKEK